MYIVRQKSEQDFRTAVQKLKTPPSFLYYAAGAAIMPALTESPPATRNIFRADSLIIAAVVSDPVTLPLVTVSENAFGTMSKIKMLMSLMSCVSVAAPGAPRGIVRGQPRYSNSMAICLTGSASFASDWALKATFTWKRVLKSPPSLGQTYVCVCVWGCVCVCVCVCSVTQL